MIHICSKPISMVKLIRIFMQKCIISEYIFHKICIHSVTKLYTPLRNCGRNGVDVFDTSCLETRKQSARKLFRRQHIGEHCRFNLYTSQNCSVEFGYLDNLRNGVVVLDDTLLRLRHEQDASRTNQQKTHLIVCTACCRRVQVSCNSVTVQ